MMVFFAVMAIGCQSKLTTGTSGQVTRVSIDRDTKTTRTKTSSGKIKKRTKISYETEIHYRYAVGGRSYTGYAEKDGNVRSRFQTGAKVLVCYNPASPEDSDIFSIGSKCGGNTL